MAVPIERKKLLCIGLVMIAVAWILFVVAVSPQDKPQVVPEGKTPPAMPAETGIKLRDAVLLQARMVIQLNTTIQTYNQLQDLLPKQKTKIDDLKAAALAEAKLDPKDWDVDLDNFQFVRTTPLSIPTGAPVVPAEKKPLK